MPIAVKLVLFDVDGVLTDGTLHYGPSGEELKSFNVKDGVAIALLKAHGITTGVLSGKSSSALRRRCEDLKFDEVELGRADKLEGLAAILESTGFSPSEVYFVGDDVVDLPLARVVGRFYAPSDAHSLVLSRADYVLEAAGGRGVARELADSILSEAGLTPSEAYQPLLGAGTEIVQ